MKIQALIDITSKDYFQSLSACVTLLSGLFKKSKKTDLITFGYKKTIDELNNFINTENQDISPDTLLKLLKNLKTIPDAVIFHNALENLSKQNSKKLSSYNIHCFSSISSEFIFIDICRQLESMIADEKMQRNKTNDNHTQVITNENNNIRRMDSSPTISVQSSLTDKSIVGVLGKRPTSSSNEPEELDDSEMHSYRKPN